MSQTQTQTAQKGDFFGAAIERTYKHVPAPELGDGKVVRLRSLTAKERDDYELDVQIKTKKGYEIDPVHVREKLIIRTVVDDAGALLFGEEDLPKLANLPSKIIVRLFTAAQELCGLSEDPEEADARLKPAQS